MGAPDLGVVLAHLGELVACDTQNPPRRIAAGDRLFRWLGDRLRAAGFAVEVADQGAGCVALHARRGAPTLLFNAHVDTVPAAAGWEGPLALRVEGERAIGLGAADTKGAAACLLAAVERTRGDAALLFTSDEEAGDDRCVRAFLEAGHRYEGVVVAEPTRCRAVLAHRGMATATGVFSGTAGHASSPRALVDSALHEAVRWASRALEAAAAEERREVGGLAGIRFNLGVLAGGTKSNVIADRAELRFGVRSRPGEDPRAVVARLQACAPDPTRATWQAGFVGPTLPPPGAGLDGAARLAARLGLAIGDPVDFWSEASLFAAAGTPALVYGPGDIAQAHAAGEWVALSQLAEAEAAYARVFT